jgi:hypothetical protein
MKIKNLLKNFFIQIDFELFCFKFYNKKEREEKDWLKFFYKYKFAKENIGEKVYKIIEKYNTKRRIKWLKKNEEEIKKFECKDPAELVKEFFYKRYLGCKFDGIDKDSTIIKIERNENSCEIHFICGNFCPILYYSLKIGENNLPICKKSYEESAKKFLEKLFEIAYGRKIEVRYTRDYNRLRPRSLFCYEIVKIHH